MPPAETPSSPKTSPPPDDTPTAAVLVIGDEVLSGRVKDTNIGTIADYLALLGIDLDEARIVPDRQDRIVEALNALRARNTYVFTTGGIGPTHDDITADAVAAAFGVPIDHHPDAVAMLRERYQGDDLNAARLRMARIPEGASLVPNPITKAPGFRIGNVIVMAGVPAIMRAMLDAVGPTLARGVVPDLRQIEAPLKEGDVAGPLAALDKRHAGVLIGSYPRFDGERYAVLITLRGRDTGLLDAAESDVRDLLQSLEDPRR
ncbi:MAG: molybdopterin-binding protein [Pseudomonadota bacterium]